MPLPSIVTFIGFVSLGGRACMDTFNIDAAVHFLGPTVPEECRQRMEHVLGCSLEELEGEKYEDDPPIYEGVVLGLQIRLCTREEIWSDERLYQLTVLCDTGLRTRSAPDLDIEFHLIKLLKHHQISEVFGSDEFADEYRRRRASTSSSTSSE